MPDEDLTQWLRNLANNIFAADTAERMLRICDRLDEAEGTLAGLVSGELDLGEVRATVVDG